MAHCFQSFQTVSYIRVFYIEKHLYYEGSRSAGAQLCDSKRNRLWVGFPFEEIKYYVLCIFILWCRGKASSTIQHTMSPEFGRH